MERYEWRVSRYGKSGSLLSYVGFSNAQEALEFFKSQAIGKGIAKIRLERRDPTWRCQGVALRENQQ